MSPKEDALEPPVAARPAVPQALARSREEGAGRPGRAWPTAPVCRPCVNEVLAFSPGAAKIAHPLMMRHREEPFAQIGAGLPGTLFDERAHKVPLNEIVGRRRITCQRLSIAPQP